jgi:hypothetical protein
VSKKQASGGGCRDWRGQAPSVLSIAAPSCPLRARLEQRDGGRGVGALLLPFLLSSARPYDVLPVLPP